MAILVKPPQSPDWASAFSSLGESFGQQQQQQRQQQDQKKYGQILNDVFSQIAKKGPDVQMFDIIKGLTQAQGQGVPAQTALAYGEQIPRLQQGFAASQAANQKANQAPPPDKGAQKWFYDQLGKGDAISSLENGINEIRELNSKGFTGPIAGHTPSWASNEEADATRKALDAAGIQILNVHKSMFPRGLTQGEFQILSQKLISSKNTQKANDEILSVYERLGQLQRRKLEATKEAAERFGYTADLPLQASKMLEQMDKEAHGLIKQLESIPTETKSQSVPSSQRNELAPVGKQELGNTQNEKVRKVRHKKTGKVKEASPELHQYVNQYPEEFEFVE